MWGFGLLTSILTLLWLLQAREIIADKVTARERERPNFKVEFDSKEVYHVNLLNRLYWTEKNERSTSKDFNMWEKVDLHLLEWPGNVTLFDQDYPVVKWGRRRAKYTEDLCGMEFNGIEMRAYAYKYVYLTWGPHRLTRTYTPPLTIPRKILPFQTMARLAKQYSYEENNLNVVVVFDLAFVFDTLLLAYSEGVVRVTGLEMGWAEMSKKPKRPLVYQLSKGLTESVDRLVVQSCCLKTDFCPYGEVVVAYREHSAPHAIYISHDSGKSFEKVQSGLQDDSFLRVVLSYPEFDALVIFHGNDSTIKRSHVIMPTIAGTSKSEVTVKAHKTSVLPLRLKGELQGQRLGMEMSYVLWDKCGAWYSPEAGPSSNLTRSLFYVHKKIGRTRRDEIVSKRCTFGKNSALAFAKTGRYGILDKYNVFYLGVDTKLHFAQLIALKMDISLLLPGTELSVFPFFDMSDRPVLMYPPKFLALPEKLQHGLGKTYERRLGMRLLPKNVYPSDFMNYFFEENAKSIEKKYRRLLLRPCETSSLKVNNSITQKRKLYPMYYRGHVNFTVLFKSKYSHTKQLMFEPRSVLKYLNVKLKLISIDQVDLMEPAYWVKYGVEIKSITASAIKKTFRINFFTKQALRCNFQPRVPVYVKVEDKPVSGPVLYEDEDMTKSVFLKSVTGGETEYLKLNPGPDPQQGQDGEKGETIKVDTCPLSKMNAK